ncbi:MAG: hypothetical protein Q8K60_01570 [Parachlamydiaceae bacterium]|nr:hypothetical protein [Parachlamydiaceae bacterium]
MSSDKISMQRIDSLISDVNSTTNFLNNVSKNQEIPLPQKQVNQLVNDLAKLNHMAEKNNLNELVGKSQILEKMDKSLEEALKAVALFKSNTTPQSFPSQRNFGQTVFAMINHLAEEMKKLGKSLRELKERKKIKVGQKVEKISESKESKERK